MDFKVALAVIGLAVGGIAGWMTAPDVSTMKLGPLSVEVTGENGNLTARSNDGQVDIKVGDHGPLDDRNTRTAIFAVIGAVVGLGAGLAFDRRKS